LEVIHTNCSHLLRYIAVVSIVERKTKEIKELVRMLNKKNTIYRDNAILNFLEELYVNVDIEKSISKLGECEKELKNDYFLNNFVGLFFQVFFKF
jgi:alcohol dehydrogenase class IV